MRRLTAAIARRLIGVQFLVNSGGPITQTCVDKVSPSGEYVLLGGGLDPNSKSWGWVETEKVEIVEFVEEDGVDKCLPPPVPPSEPEPVKKYLFIGGPRNGEWHKVRKRSSLMKFWNFGDPGSGPGSAGKFHYYRAQRIETPNSPGVIVYKSEEEPIDVLQWLLGRVASETECICNE